MRLYLRAVVFGLVVLVLLAIPLVAIAARSYFLAPTAQPPKAQPIAFPHPFHVDVLGLQCTFCHRDATTEAFAGLPALQQCMFCHKVIPVAGRAPLATLVNSYNNNIPVDWNRVYQLPDHVHFVHATHINAGIQCQTCHGMGNGNAANMQTVYQFRDLRMGDCISCHREYGARTDCSVCHY
ncbi:MAG TPA: cytochrome c3 family protein [Thermomicrobiaceae bacterium]|nr:cytochrome c3 family protein [Thermomicrobiaceae bacterium]